MRVLLGLLSVVCLGLACREAPSSESVDSTNPAPARSELGIRPNGDTEIQPDLTKVSPELKKVYEYIDDHIDEHVENLQKWIRQPSISNSGEGIPESAEMVKGFFEGLGCQESRVYDVGTTEWGLPGNPVVFARCNEGAPRTLILYWMYDTMPITQPELWSSPPFEARLVEQAPFKKVLIGRGASNSKGPHMAQLNALRSIKAVAGKLPVNLIIVAEGDEERMSLGLRKFVKDHPDFFKDGEALVGIPTGQTYSGNGSIGGGSEGCVCFELTTSGDKWGKGPNRADIAGIHALYVDKPAWRHMKMLASLVSADGRQVEVEGFYDNVEPISPEALEAMKEDAKSIDLQQAAKNVPVARFMTDDPVEFLKLQRNGVSFNLDGIWGGNMYAGGAGAIIPNRITSKHQIRYQANQDGIDLAKKVRRQLDKNGYEDVELKMIGDVPWCKVPLKHDLARAQARALEAFNIPFRKPRELDTLTAPYWPAYLFGSDPIKIPISSAGAGHGWRQHGTNEFFVIEGAGKVYGLAGAEKFQAAVLYNFGGKN